MAAAGTNVAQWRGRQGFKGPKILVHSRSVALSGVFFDFFFTTTNNTFAHLSTFLFCLACTISVNLTNYTKRLVHQDKTSRNICTSPFSENFVRVVKTQHDYYFFFTGVK